MKIACPQCRKNYNIPENYIQAPGRTLQCNGCNNKWFYSLTTINHVADTLSESDQESITITPVVTEILVTGETIIDKSHSHIDPTIQGEKTCSSRSNMNSMILSAVTLVLVLLNLYVARQKIVDHFPATYIFYEKLNIPIAYPPHHQKSSAQQPVSTLNEEHVVANAHIKAYQASNQSHTVII